MKNPAGECHPAVDQMELPVEWEDARQAPEISISTASRDAPVVLAVRIEASTSREEVPAGKAALTAAPAVRVRPDPVRAVLVEAPDLLAARAGAVPVARALEVLPEVPALRAPVVLVEDREPRLRLWKGRGRPKNLLRRKSPRIHGKIKNRRWGRSSFRQRRR
jgi:hypothetical protein